MLFNTLAVEGHGFEFCRPLQMSRGSPVCTFLFSIHVCPKDILSKGQGLLIQPNYTIYSTNLMGKLW